MLKIEGLDSLAFAIVSLGLVTPMLLPAPGSALQHSHYSFASARQTIPNNIVQKMKREGNFRLFLSALKDTGMDKTLETEPGPYTVFAPNDRAFASLTKDAFTRLFEDKTRLKTVVKFHIVPRKVLTSEIKFDSLRTLCGEFLMTNISNSKTVSVGGALVNKPDILCRNGVVQSIDTVLFPLTGMENLAMQGGQEDKR